MEKSKEELIEAAHKMAEELTRAEIPIPLFPDMGLSIIVLSDRVKELEAVSKYLSARITDIEGIIKQLDDYAKDCIRS